MDNPVEFKYEVGEYAVDKYTMQRGKILLREMRKTKYSNQEYTPCYFLKTSTLEYWVVEGDLVNAEV